MRIFPLLLAVAISADAAPNDPGAAAIEFLEKVRVGNLNLEPGGDTAISAQTASEKKQGIARRLERVARDLGDDPLEVGAVKQDENYAGVLVRKVGGFDPSRLQVFAVALVKRDTGWSAAPVSASFENAGAGYAIALRKRLETLENWMLREQVADLQQLREQAHERMRDTIQARITIDELRKMSPRQVCERFLAACESGDLPTVLGLTGGLALQLPDDWPARLKSADRALVAGPAAIRPWRLFTAPEVVRVIVQQEEETHSAMISLACLDPAGMAAESSKPRVELVHFGLEKGTHGLWQINLSNAFLDNSQTWPDEPEESLDADLLNAFPTKFTEIHSPNPQPTANQAHQALITALRGDNFRSLLTLSSLDTNSETARKSCVQAASLWWEFHDPSAVRQAVPLAFKADESAAAGVFQLLSARDPNHFNPRTLYFEKSESGWFWTSQPSVALRESFKAWADAETTRGSHEWQSKLLANSPVIENLDELPMPTEGEARTLVENWLATTRLGNLDAALRLVARLDGARSETIALQNINYEILGARQSNAEARITGIYQQKAWTAVGVRITREGKATYPLYPVLGTEQGPRILIETDLFASGNRGREFLNKAALDRLEKATSEASVNDLQELYSKHQADVERSFGNAAR